MRTMVNADEDTICNLETQASADSSDNEDDSPQDFRFLATLSSSRNVSIPRRGLKDFEPDPTKLQSSTLAASRKAMHDALSYTRVHAPKTFVVGIYSRENGLTTVNKSKGSLFKSIGRGVRNGGVELLPEEALWALERGSLDVRWPIDEERLEEQHPGAKKIERTSHEVELENQTTDTIQDDEVFGLPMSLQGAYATFLGEEELRGGNLTLDRYLVYSNLKRSGYVVLRAEGFEGRPPRGKTLTPMKPPQMLGGGLYTWIYRLLLDRRNAQFDFDRQRIGPLIAPGLYRSYNEIYRLLSLIPAGHHSEPKEIPPTDNIFDNDQHPFTTTYNIYKPSPNYRKTAPGIPSFRVSVISARDTRVPTLSQLSDLLNEQSLVEETKDKQSDQTSVSAMYKRLRQDGRNVILAVVDEGIISYIRLSEACFAEEKVYERVGRGGGKRGGGGGRGRGNGRGGRGGRAGKGRGANG